MVAPESPAYPLLFIADGDPLDTSTNSGVPKHLIDSLRLRIGTPMFFHNGHLSGLHYRMLSILSMRFTKVARFQARNFGRMSMFYRFIILYAKVLLLKLRYKGVNLLQVRGLHLHIIKRNVRLFLYLDTSVVLTEREWPKWSTKGKLLEFRKRIEKANILNASRIFVVSEYLKSFICDYYDLNESKVVVVGNGISEIWLDELDERKTSNNTETDNTFNIFFVGRERERKGLDILEEACEIARTKVNHPVILHVIGIDQESSNSVRYYGRLSSVHTRIRLQEGDVFCLPSRHEPFGIALIEAMSLGLPCIATNINAFPEILGCGRYGQIVESGSADALASALIWTSRNYSEALDIALKGRSHVRRNFTWNMVASRMLPYLIHE